MSGLPYLAIATNQYNGAHDGTVDAIFSGGEQRRFVVGQDDGTSTYNALRDGLETLTYAAPYTLGTTNYPGVYTFTDTVGDVIKFYDLPRVIDGATGPNLTSDGLGRLYSGSGYEQMVTNQFLPGGSAVTTDPYPFGGFISETDRYGNVTAATYDGSGQLQYLTRTEPGGEKERFEIAYSTVANDLGGSASLISSVKLENRSATATNYTTVRTADYIYYSGTTTSADSAYGRLGDLKLATIKDNAGNVIDNKYYRYNKLPTEQFDDYTGAYDKRGATNNPTNTGGTDVSFTQGSPDNQVASALKTIVEDASYARMTADLGTGLTSFDGADDSVIDPYADNTFRYEQYIRYTLETAENGDAYRAVSEKDAGSGCTSCAMGFGNYKYEYYNRSAAFQYDGFDPNKWIERTTEYLPDDTLSDWTDNDQNIVYTNEIGEVMLKVFVDKHGTSDTSDDTMYGWFYRYDSAGRQTLAASPSAVDLSAGLSALEGYDDLMNYSQGHFEYLRDTSGLITNTDYYTSTDSGLNDTTVSGGVDGYVRDSTEQRGQLGGAQAATSISQSGVVATATFASAHGLHVGDVVNISGAYEDAFDGRFVVTSVPSSTTFTYTLPNDPGVGYASTGTAFEVVRSDLQERQTYFTHTYGTSGASVHPVATDTVFRNADGTGGQTTSYQYGWYTGTLGVKSIKTTLPTIDSLTQNGPGTADFSTEYFDDQGRPAFEVDADGHVSYYGYDDSGTGALVKSIQDVDYNLLSTDEQSQYDGFGITHVTGGLNLVTTDTVDSLGRTLSETSPAGNVTLTRYNDANHEVRVYRGWHSVGGGNSNTTGPVQISRTYWPTSSGNPVYNENLTATIANGSTLPDGTEPLATVQTASRDYTNQAGQVVRSDRYFSLAGTSYSTSPYFGVAGTNYYTTTMSYDGRGRLKRTETPNGTISRTVYDGLGRVLSQWVGTNDTPTSGYWAPSGTSAAGMVDVADYYYDAYDGTQGIGDGNLTRVVQHPTGDASTLRVTEDFYDWRDRLVMSKSGVLLDGNLQYAMPGGETDNAHRLITYLTYDNLDEVTGRDRYAADGYSPSGSNGVVIDTNTDGIPDAPPAGSLRAKVVTAYDDQGRAFRSSVFSVNPASGTVLTGSLDTNVFYNHRGLVVDQVQPGGLAVKSAYDGAGRIITQYETDGGAAGGTPGTLQNWTNAASVSGDVVIQQVETAYDLDDNVVQTTTRQRYHDDPISGTNGLGALQTPSSGPKARVYYTTNFYDAADRLTATADYGTNGSNGLSGISTTSAPARSDTVLVTSYGYAGDSVQTIGLSGSPTGGTFTLTFLGHTTGGIAYNATPAMVQGDLEVLSGVGAGQVSVVGVAGQYYTVRFTGSLGEQALPPLSAASSLTGGTSPAATLTAYIPGGDAGEVAKVTDPRNIVSKTDRDLLGRTVSTVSAFTTGIPGAADNQLTAYSYDGDDHVLTQTAWNKGTSTATFQTTAYVYDAKQSAGSALDSKDLLTKVEYPDLTTGNASTNAANVVSFSYFATGDQATKTDQNGTTHGYGYDALGRLTTDTVALASGNPQHVDTAVMEQAFGFNDAGQNYLNTSYDGSGNMVNQEEKLYDGLGNLVKDYQSAYGPVTFGGVGGRNVQYVYDFSHNHDRLVEMIYPNGRVLHYGYNSGLDDAISRVDYLADDNGLGSAASTHLVNYSYLGDSTVVIEDRPEEGVELSYVKQSGDTLAISDGGDQYSGLDRFGRIEDQNWINDSTGATVDRVQSGYDRDGNVLYERNLSSTNSVSFSMLFAYDDLNRLTSSARGTLDSTGTSITAANALADYTESWDLDSQGNWTSKSVDANPPSHRKTNSQNELTDIDGTALSYDADGNTITDENGQTYTYDAWNRIATVTNVHGTNTYAYVPGSANAGQYSSTAGINIRLWYSQDGQLVQETNGNGGAVTQYVWGLTYVNDLILRDQDADGNSSTGSLGKAGSGIEQRGYALRDANHDVTAITDSGGGVWERFAYDPYGAEIVLDGTYNVTTDSKNWLYLFQGGRKDAFSGLYLFGAREYSVTLGRWLQQDPKAFIDGADLYQMELGNPLNFVDPTGNSTYPQGFPGPRPVDNDPGADDRKMSDLDDPFANGDDSADDKKAHDKCEDLYKFIMDKGEKLSKKIIKYDPVSDGLGGSAYRAGGRMNVSKPGSHFDRITGQQRTLKDLIKEYDDKCGDPCKKLPKSLRDMVYTKIPLPQYPGLPNYARGGQRTSNVIDNAGPWLAGGGALLVTGGLAAGAFGIVGGVGGGGGAVIGRIGGAVAAAGAAGRAAAQTPSSQ